MQTRRADLNDIQQTHRLFCDYLRFYKREVNAERSLNFLTERLTKNESAIFLAEENGTAFGFVQLFPSFSSLGQSRSWILNDLYVDSNKRNLGLGEKLIKAAVSFAKESGAKSLSLQTANDNVKAQGLYQKLGWKKDEEYLTYYFSL